MLHTLKRLSYILALLLACAGVGHAQSCAGSWSNGYTYCRVLTVANGQIPGSLTAFPIPFCFNMTEGNGNACPNNNGVNTDLKVTGSGGTIQHTVTFNGQTCPADINFYSNSSGSSALNWDCASYTGSSGALEVYVSMNVTTGANYVYMFYDQAAISTYQGGAVGAAYDANYTLVQHFPNGSTLSYKDSSQSGNNGAAAGTPTAGTGQIDGGITTSSSNAESSSMSITYATFTLEFWMNPSSLAGTPRAVANAHTDSNNNGFQFFPSNSAPSLQIGNGSTNAIAGTGVAMSTSTWYSIVCTYNGANVQCYNNGAVGNAPPALTGNMTNDTNSSVGVGYDPTYSGDYCSCTIDEVRISNTARSANWITATYNAESAPSTWFAVSAASSQSANPLGTKMAGPARMAGPGVMR